MATELLKQVWTQIEALPPVEQDAFAERMQRELEALSDRAWDDLLATPASRRLLERLVTEARDDYQTGKTIEVGEEW